MNTVFAPQRKQQINKSIHVIVMGPSLQQNGGMAEVQKLIVHAPVKSLQVQHICTHDEGSLFHRTLVFGKAVIAFYRTLVMRDADLIHIHMSERGSVLRTIFLVVPTFIFRCPVLIHTHGAEFVPFFLNLPIWIKISISYIFRHCSGFIVLSQSWKDFYSFNMKLREKRVFTLPNSVVIPPQIPKRIASKTITLAFCGRIGQRKGAFDLIQAIALLPNEIKRSIKLVLAGDGETNEANVLASKHGISNIVQCLGWINTEQRDQLLESADIFILPSYNEGLPLAILEAMAWRLPVITTPVGGIPEVISQGENGLLVQPGNIKQLSQSIQYLVEDSTLRTIMGKKARETAKLFDADSYSQKILKIYETTLQNYHS